MATIREVAAAANVSIATVSRALNSPESLLPETLHQVMEVVEQMNYQIKPKQKKMTNLFGVVLPDISNPFFAELLEVIERESYLHGRSILFFNSQHNARQELIALHECEMHGVDGVFLVPVGDLRESYQDKLNQFKYQTVILTRRAVKLPSVSTDHQSGGRQSAAHLLSQGHNHIGYIGGIVNDDKYLGFANYLAEQGYQLKPEYCFDVDNRTDLEEFLQTAILQHQISALGCCNDVYVQKIQEILPRFSANQSEVSLVGFDNTLISRLLNFTSISQPMREIAHIGFELMLKALKEKKSTDFQPILLPPKLVIR